MEPTRPDHGMASPRFEEPRYRRARLRWQRAQGWLIGLLRSFGYALAGLKELVRRQRNAQIHVVLTLVACSAGWAWGLTRLEWMILVLAIGLVLGLEAVNTAVEAVVDLVSPQFHPLAKLAKDVAAGGVLLAALCTLVVALLLFGSRLLALLSWLLG